MVQKGCDNRVGRSATHAAVNVPRRQKKAFRKKQSHAAVHGHRLVLVRLHTGAMRAGVRDGRAPRDCRRGGGDDGRDHHPHGFTIWMAGAGLRGGVVHGGTDELGFHALDGGNYVTDVHATVLHLLGLDPQQLDVPGQKRLDMDRGSVIKSILA